MKLLIKDAPIIAKYWILKYQVDTYAKYIDRWDYALILYWKNSAVSKNIGNKIRAEKLEEEIALRYIHANFEWLKNSR